MKKILSRTLNKLIDVAKSITKRLELVIIILEDIFVSSLPKRRCIGQKKAKSNIIIIGGELFNKGAQAMTFTAVDKISHRFPKNRIYLFSSSDFKRNEEEKNNYKFSILPWDFDIKVQLLNPLRTFFRINYSNKHVVNKIKNIINDADFFIDISGYALSSQWGWLRSANYLLNIAVAKRLSVPYYIFPQSIGPFSYRLSEKFPLFWLMKRYLKYPKKIFVREVGGFNSLLKFTKKNVEKSYDIVLRNNGHDLNKIYYKIPDFKNIKIEYNSVGLIPNLKVIERTKPNLIYPIYKSLIDTLIKSNREVYILRHSFEDLYICEKIKGLYPDNANVKLIDDDLNAIELENIIKQFEFVVASRYHSIVHSYKNGVPALVIGWATKYFELLDEFSQLDYFFDIREGIQEDKIIDSLEKLIANSKTERDKIINKLNILNKEPIFSYLNN